MLRSATFAFSRNSTIFAVERNVRATLADFWAVLALIIFHFWEIWGQIGTLSTHNLSIAKFIAVRKLQLLASILFSLSVPLG